MTKVDLEQTPVLKAHGERDIVNTNLIVMKYTAGHLKELKVGTRGESPGSPNTAFKTKSARKVSTTRTNTTNS